MRIVNAKTINKRRTNHESKNARRLRPPRYELLMRQAQKMQEDMKAKQAELEAAEYTGSASGEMVTVKMNGKHEVLSITIKPEAVDPDDIEMLEDLVAAAVNATVKQVDETAEAEMGKLTGGLNIPGL